MSCRTLLHATNSTVTVSSYGFGSSLTCLPMYSRLSCVLKTDNEDVVDISGTKRKSDRLHLNCAQMENKLDELSHIREQTATQIISCLWRR